MVMRVSAFDPPAIPADVWARPDVTAALRQRDIRALIGLLRQRAGISQTRIAASTGYPQGRISNYATGKHKIKDMAVWERIADGLNMPDLARACLGLSPQTQAALPPAVKPGSQPEQETELLRRIAVARHIDESVIGALQAETDAIRLLDRRLGAPAVADKLQMHIGQLDSTLRHSLRPGQRQPLATVAADACALAGWQAIDMRHLPEAWDYFEKAIAAAREAGDTCLLAFATGEQAYVLADLGHYDDALAMVEAAYVETHLHIPHQIRAWLRAAEGEMAAAAGLETACRHALDQAADEISHGPSGEDLPYLALNTAHLARWRGNCLVTFGDPHTADELATALNDMDGTFTRAEAGLRCDLAAALHAQGESEEAHRHLSRARHLAQLTGSARQRRRIRQLARKIGDAA
jgi:tetratricopeptide (TPR) repeat protein